MSENTVDELSHMPFSKKLEVIDDTDPIKSNLAKLGEIGFDNYETSHRQKSGHDIDVEFAKGYLAPFGQYGESCHESLRRKKSESIHNAIFNASSEGMISCDLCNAIVSANPTVETVFGFKQAELIGHCIGLLIPILVESKSTCRDIVEEGKPKTEINEVVGRHKNCYSVCPWSIRKLPIRLMTPVIL